MGVLLAGRLGTGPTVLRARRKGDFDARPALRRVDGQEPTEEGCALSEGRRTQIERGQPFVIVVSLEREPSTVIGHDDARLSLPDANLQPTRGGPGMPGYVHERLVDDQADIDPSARRKGGEVFRVNINLQAPLALEPTDQVLQPRRQTRVELPWLRIRSPEPFDQHAQYVLLFVEIALHLD